MSLANRLNARARDVLVALDGSVDWDRTKAWLCARGLEGFDERARALRVALEVAGVQGAISLMSAQDDGRR